MEGSLVEWEWVVWDVYFNYMYRGIEVERGDKRCCSWLGLGKGMDWRG